LNGVGPAGASEVVSAAAASRGGDQGRLAQLVEHLVYTERVGGSSPSPPTSRSGAARKGRGARSAFAALGSVGFLWLAAISGSPALADQGTMTFRAVNFDSTGCAADCPQVIIADGVIDAGTPQAFVEFARQAAQTEQFRGVIFLNSPGGNVVASMELGRAFRRARAAVMVAGFATMGTLSGPVAGECLSACVYALMGAARRVAPPGSRIALHRMFSGDLDGAQNGIADRGMVTEVARYAAQMGVDPALVWRAESQAPGVLRVLTTAEITRWRLATTRY
jgi:hypothetical protein